MHIVGPFVVGLVTMALGFWLLTSDINFTLNTTIRTILVIALMTITLGFWWEAFFGKRDRKRKQ